MPLEVMRTTASVGASILGSGTSSTRTSRLPCQVTAFIRIAPSRAALAGRTGYHGGGRPTLYRFRSTGRSSGRPTPARPVAGSVGPWRVPTVRCWSTPGLTVVLGVAFLASTAGASDARALDGLGVALLAANVLPLLALRRAPLLVLACFSVAYPAWALLEYPTHLLQSLPTPAAMFAVGASPRPLWWRALALLTPVEMLAAAASGIWPVDPLELGYVAIMFVSGWVLGIVLAARRSYTAALEEKTAALEAARQELAHRAVLEERTRIARDLHDILAHAMSVITVQAGVGAHLLERDPTQARRALVVIEETGRGGARGDAAPAGGAAGRRPADRAPAGPGLARPAGLGRRHRGGRAGGRRGRGGGARPPDLTPPRRWSCCGPSTRRPPGGPSSPAAWPSFSS